MTMMCHITDEIVFNPWEDPPEATNDDRYDDFEYFQLQQRFEEEFKQTKESKKP
jgi:hypothetical protein